jgi:hypothetical protein
MDGAILNEINHLSDDAKKVNLGTIYDLMIFSIKGRQKCEEERKKFVLNRSLPIQKMHDPTFIKLQTEEFLNCYSNMVNYSKEKCNNQYNQIFLCLKSQHGNSKGFPEKCVKQMEEFILC